MARGKKLPNDEYYDMIATSRFMYSPNGDRPECYRHYEAIAFGTIPITELDQELYPHFANFPIIYNNSNWRNLTENEAIEMILSQQKNMKKSTGGRSSSFSSSSRNTTAMSVATAKILNGVQRNMIFEEYWLEYVEKIVGRKLRWYDRKGKKKAFLEAFDNSTRDEI